MMNPKEKLGFLSVLIAFGIIFGYISAGTYCLGLHYDVSHTIEALVYAGLAPAILLSAIGVLGLGAWTLLEWGI